MARANLPLQSRHFMRALADEMDRLSPPAQRDELLRNIGWRIALQLPLAGAQSLDGLETEINNALAMLEWGEARLAYDEADHCLRISHAGLPELGSLGPWLSASLEGLYGAWLAGQPGADPALRVVRTATVHPGQIEMKYARV